MTEPGSFLHEKYEEMLQVLGEDRNKALTTINDSYAKALAAGGNPTDLYRRYLAERTTVVDTFSYKGRAIGAEYAQLAGSDAPQIGSSHRMVPAFPAPQTHRAFAPGPATASAVRAQRPAKKPRATKVMQWIGAGILIFIAAIVVTQSITSSSTKASGTGTGAGTRANLDTGRTVVYEVEGTAKTASVTMATPTGTSQATTNVPLLNKSGAIGVRATMKRGDFAYISAQNRGSSGSITCKITVDGVLISKVTSTGGYTIASCDGRVP